MSEITREEAKTYLRDEAAGYERLGRFHFAGILRLALAALEDAEGDALTADERAECDIESHYGRSKTGLHIDHKGRMFARDDRNVVVLNEAADAVMFLAKVAALVQIQRAAIDRARGV